MHARMYFVNRKTKLVVSLVFLVIFLLMTTFHIVYSQVPPEQLVKAQIIGGKPTFVPPKTLVMPIPRPGEVNEGYFEIAITNENDEPITADVEFEWVKKPEGVDVAAPTVTVSAASEGQAGATSVKFHIDVLHKAQPSVYEIKLRLRILTIGGRPLDRSIEIDPTIVLTTSVGGIWLPIDKLDLLVPYIGLFLAIIAAIVSASIYAKRMKPGKTKKK